MTITNVNNNSYSSNDKPKKNKATLNAGLSWFAVDMAVSTAVDVYYNSKSKTQLTAKTLCKQVGTNALWAGISACIFAYPLAKIYEYTKQKKYEVFSNLSTATASILMGFRLYMASRPHPKWKNVRFGNFF